MPPYLHALALPDFAGVGVVVRLRSDDLQQTLHIAVDIAGPHAVRLSAAGLGECRTRLAGLRADEVAVGVCHGGDGEGEGGDGELHFVWSLEFGGLVCLVVDDLAISACNAYGRAPVLGRNECNERMCRLTELGNERTDCEERTFLCSMDTERPK